MIPAIGLPMVKKVTQGRIKAISKRISNFQFVVQFPERGSAVQTALRSPDQPGLSVRPFFPIQFNAGSYRSSFERLGLSTSRYVDSDRVTASATSAVISLKSRLTHATSSAS